MTMGWIHNRRFVTALLTGGVAIISLLALAWYLTLAYFLDIDATASRVRHNASDVDIRFLEARRAEKDFLLRDLDNPDFHARGESAYLVKHAQMLAMVDEDLKALSTLTRGEIHDAVAQMSQLVGEYRRQFQELVAAYRERGYKDWGLEGEWRKAIHDAERRVKQARDPALEVRLLQLRRDEKDYLLRREQRYVEAVRADLAALVAAVRSSRVPESAELLESLKQYEALFTRYLAIQEKIGNTIDAGIQGALQQTVHQLEPLLDRTMTQAERAGAAAVRQLARVSVVILVAGVALACLFFYFFARSMADPVRRLATAATAIGQGHLGSRVDFASRSELGVLARSFNEMVAALSQLVGRVQQSAIQVNTSLTELGATSNEQQATAAEISATTTEIGATSKEISATSRELAATMREVAGVAEQTATLAGSGQQGLARMEETMHQVMNAAGSINAKLAVLNEKAGNIGQVVTTITKVADQTNLLSLNAAIEAEKAGEYGRGFAVVAAEIRRLADQTAVATDDIEQMVKEIQSAVSAGVMGMDKFSEEVRRGMQEVQQAGGQLSQIIQQVQALTPRFEAVNEGMQAQATGAEQISQALGQLSEAARQTVESLRQSSAVIGALSQVSSELREGVSRFKLQAT